MKRMKCDTAGCASKKIKEKGSKTDSFTCYRCRRKASRKPKQEAYAAAHAPAQVVAPDPAVAPETSA